MAHRQLRPVVAMQIACAQAVCVDGCFCAQHSHYELFARRFKTEYGNRYIRVRRWCCAMFKTNAVLPIDGRAAIMTEVGRLESGSHGVEIVEA